MAAMCGRSTALAATRTRPPEFCINFYGFFNEAQLTTCIRRIHVTVATFIWVPLGEPLYPRIVFHLCLGPEGLLLSPPAMTSLTFHSQLSSIMETMARSALDQVSKLVDEDVAELRLSWSQLLAANAALTDKVSSLESELSTVRSDRLSKSQRSVGVQTVHHRAGDPHVSPAIEGIFGKDWCMELWNRDHPHSHLREKSVGTLPSQMTVAEIKEEKDYAANAASSCQQETSTTVAEHEEGLIGEPEQLSVGYSADDSTCSLSFDRDAEPVMFAGGIGELTMKVISISDTDETFSMHTIPVEEEEEEDDDDCVQFIEDSQQVLPMDSEGGLDLDTLQTFPSNSDFSTVVEDDSLEDFNEEANPNKDKFTCEICGMMFFHKGTLTQHMKSHKSNYCNICKHQFTHERKFLSHACRPSVSPGKVSKACDWCGKVFANPSALRIHYVVHTGEKPHRCSFCGKGFTQKGNLKCHLRIHTGERPFCCLKCGKTFTQKVNLNHHLMAHKTHSIP